MNEKLLCSQLEAAKAYGHTELLFTWSGIGDNIALLYVTEVYYQQTGKKLLVGTNLRQLFMNFPGVDLVDINFIEMWDEKILALYREVAREYGIELLFLTPTKLQNLPNIGSITIWPKQHYLARYCERAGLSGTVKQAPHLYLTDQEKQFGKIFADRQIAIMSNGLQYYKTWNLSKIQKIIDTLGNSYNFVQIGSNSDVPLQGALNLAGRLTLRQTAALLSNSCLFVGGIGGLMHLARSVDCPSVITYSAGEALSYDSYSCNRNIMAASCCKLCSQNLRDPQHQPCVDYYSCVRNIDYQDVENAIVSSMEAPLTPLAVDTYQLTADKVCGLDDFLAVLHANNDHIGDFVSKINNQ